MIARRSRPAPRQKQDLKASGPGAKPKTGNRKANAKALLEGLTAPQLVEAMLTEPTLDELMDRDPASVDLPTLVEALRKDRARFLQKESERKDRKDGLDSPAETPATEETDDATS